jgi:hypothetical protein
MFPVKNGLKQENALSPVLFHFALEYEIWRVYAGILGGNVHIIKKNAGALVVDCKENGLEVNADRSTW